MEEFLFQLLVPQEFEAIEICRVMWTWYIGIKLLPLYFRLSPSYDSPLNVILGLLFGMVFWVIFALSVGLALLRVQNLLPVVHNPFIASVIVLVNASIPITIGAKIMDKI
tara:strand:+ start:182 stop:511 length:330 start_codon:yes stop_codon:yes gene_type:complete